MQITKSISNNSQKDLHEMDYIERFERQLKEMEKKGWKILDENDPKYIKTLQLSKQWEYEELNER